MQETWVQYLGGKDPLEKGMATQSSILAWRSLGQRSLAGYSPWGRTESDTTEVTQQQQQQQHSVFYFPGGSDSKKKICM